MAEFESAIAHVLKNEGGYVNDSKDAGGETNFGISKRAFPDVDIRALTPREAEKIYRRKYWDAYPQLERLADQAVATKVFDLMVNMGPGTAARLFQSSINLLAKGVRPIPVDGRLGPMTVRRANELDAQELLTALRESAAN